MWIGSKTDSPERTLNGKIDEILIYNVPLTDAEICQIYNEFN